ncbi:MAG: patatin-like phospholipase family protein [Bacillota bacterium]
MGKFRVITFDGGGVRGALTATLLKRLDEKYPHLIKETELFAGTSTGSFIALGLAYGLSIEKITDLYSLENGRLIFSAKSCGLIRPKYSNRRLRELLLKVFPQDLRLKDLKKYVIIPSFRVNGSNLKRWTPIFFNNFPDSNNKDVLVIDAALSSSAAPIYFPSYNQHIDGGLIANNPAVAAISLASDPYYANKICDEICLLSIGTGYNPHKLTGDTTKWGLLQWLLNTSTPMPLETIMFEGSVEADSYFSYQILKDRFYRLNPQLNKTIALDNYKEIPYLISLAQNYDLTESLYWINKFWASEDLISQTQLTKPSFDWARARYWHDTCNKKL